MNISFIKKEGNARLLLIFAGWGMDARPFGALVAEGYDIAVAWDYTDEQVDRELLSRYREIAVIAWSMGVYEAARCLPGADLPVTLTVAVNGTMTPVNDLTGIPTAVFDGTLASLSEATLQRFNRRMCGSAPALNAYNATKPQRDIDSLRLELESIGRRARLEAVPELRWDAAVIGGRDMIFPAEGQRNAWQGISVTETDEPHLPDFQKIINQFVINKIKVAQRFGATRPGYDRDATFQHSVGEHLVAQLLKLAGGREIGTAIEIGAGSGRLAAIYSPTLAIDRLELWDIAPITPEQAPEGAVIVTDDAEARLRTTPDNSADLIISASTLQWFNSPVRGLMEIERVLRPGGIAAVALYVEGTYRSCADTLGSSLHYADPASLISALRHSNIHFSELGDDTVRFDSTRELLDHLRSTGVNATAAISPSQLRKALTDNSLRQLEYRTLYLIFTKL